MNSGNMLLKENGEVQKAHTAGRGRLPLCAALLFVSPQIVCAQSILGTNLVVNGGAEAGSAGTSLSTIVTSIPGWTATGGANVLQYGLTGMLQSNNPAPPDHAFQYFVASAQTGTSTLTQDIDVTSGASVIAAGNIKFTASAYLGNANSTPTGSAQATFAFKNANGQTFSTVTLGPESPGATTAALELAQQTGLVPVGTARITVTLTLTEFSGRGYGAADSVSIVLNTLGTNPASVLGPNLVTNPGGDQGPGVPSPAAALYIPGWSSHVSQQVPPASVAPYGGAGWIGTSDPGPSDRGVNLFWGAYGATLYQDLDVSPAAAAIDSGKVTYQVSAWLGGSLTSANLTYLFFDWTGTQLAPTAQLVTAAHTGIFGLALTAHSDFLPAGTRRVRITLNFPATLEQTASMADDVSFTLSPAGAPVISAGGVVPVFSSSLTIAPGSWCSIFGTNLAGTTTSWNGDFPTMLGGTSVTVNSKPAYLWFVSPLQINFQAPDDSATGSVNVVVTTSAGSYSSTVTLGQYAPSFSLNGNPKYAVGIVLTSGGGNSGSGYDNIGPSGTLGFTSRPVKAGETLVLFGVGFGPTTPFVAPGAIFSGSAPSVTKPQVTIGGVTASVTYAGIVEAGLFQLNVVVPAAGSGDRLLQATVGGMTTPANVYVTLQ